MTAVRPEPGGAAGPPSYEDTAEFAAAVDQLADPLSDPLPGRQAPRPAAPAPAPAPAAPAANSGISQGSPWFAPQQQPGAQARPQRPRRPVPPQGQAQGQAREQAQHPPAPPAYETYAPEPQAPPEPAPVRTPAPAPDATAELPRFEADSTPPAAVPVPAPAPATSAPATPTPVAPPPGGRAERRKAAKHGGRRRPVTADRPEQHSEHPASPQDGPPRPASRLEARRAARAAKESPLVVASRVTGELFITIGVLMLLFVVYQLWYTNVLAHEAAGSATKHLQSQWSQSTASSDAGEPDKFPSGTVFAIIYIPKLDVKAPIAEGVDKTKILDKGEVGHYDGAQETAMPWAKTGNFALAGHRNTHGEPFRYINKLVPGDKVVVETRGMYYTYQITSALPQTSPTNVSVIEPVPPGSGFTKPGRYITLTTCTPEFTSEFRMIVWGKMVAEQPRSQGTPAALQGG
ncbi:class E sortase [Streptomyces sp. PTM05]|uniref:Class E sortase n=1 Tax=Streptantibioticus parmotrematis TaxID=2873249 RepID=A0ABS7QYU8_9ACTN|nr:class E sortase [Streptantibioticus parmotrematis]MBY8888108.1 class E sortase [Streptantibioticus parmotrematis]